MMEQNNQFSRPIDNPNASSFIRNSLTPQPQSGSHGAFDHSGPKIEKNLRPNIIISKPSITKNISTTAKPVQPTINIVTTNPPPSESKPSSISFPTRIQSNPPTHAPNPVISQPPAPTPISTPAPTPAPSPAPAPPEQIPDFFSKMSLLSFVTSFQDSQSYNETDLFSLGLDLKREEPLLPLLHSVLSDAPLLNHSCYNIPESYPKDPPKVGQLGMMGLYSDQTLLFIFYTKPQNELQTAAAGELNSRGYTYDSERRVWSNKDQSEWDVDQWKFVESQKGNTQED